MSDVAIIVPLGRDVRVVDDLVLFGFQLVKNVFLNGCIKLSGGSGSFVLDREVVGIITITLDELVEPGMTISRNRIASWAVIPLFAFFPKIALTCASDSRLCSWDIRLRI